MLTHACCLSLIGTHHLLTPSSSSDSSPAANPLGYLAIASSPYRFKTSLQHPRESQRTPIERPDEVDRILASAKRLIADRIDKYRSPTLTTSQYLDASSADNARVTLTRGLMRHIARETMSTQSIDPNQNTRQLTSLSLTSLSSSSDSEQELEPTATDHTVPSAGTSDDLEAPNVTAANLDKTFDLITSNAVNPNPKDAVPEGSRVAWMESSATKVLDSITAAGSASPKKSRNSNGVFVAPQQKLDDPAPTTQSNPSCSATKQLQMAAPASKMSTDISEVHRTNTHSEVLRANDDDDDGSTAGYSDDFEDEQMERFTANTAVAATQLDSTPVSTSLAPAPPSETDSMIPGKLALNDLVLNPTETDATIDEAHHHHRWSPPLPLGVQDGSLYTQRSSNVPQQSVISRSYRATKTPKTHAEWLDEKMEIERARRGEHYRIGAIYLCKVSFPY